MKYLYTLTLLLFLYSCSEYKYPKDKTISDKNGVLVDSLGSYLPEKIIYNGDEYSLHLSVERAKTYNDFFRLMQEPVLYNYYLGRDIYRFGVAKDGEAKLLFSVNHLDKRAWLVSKRERMAAEDLESGAILKSHFDNHTRELNKEQWLHFDSLFSRVDIFSLQNANADTIESNDCLLEVHQSGKYWYVYRSGTNSDIDALCKFVRSLTRF